MCSRLRSAPTFSDIAAGGVLHNGPTRCLRWGSCFPHPPHVPLLSESGQVVGVSEHGGVQFPSRAVPPHTHLTHRQAEYYSVVISEAAGKISMPSFCTSCSGLCIVCQFCWRAQMNSVYRLVCSSVVSTYQ